MKKDLNKTIKRSTALLCAFALFLTSLFSLSSCNKEQRDDGVVNIVCTAFPQYDWLKAVVGESEAFSLSLLVDNGSDLHGYQPTVADKVRIAECDILVTVGGESDKWAEEMLEDNSNTRLVRLFDVPYVTLCEVDETGIASEHIHKESGEEHHDDHGHGHTHDHSPYDEHIWLSLSNAKVCVEYFKNILSEAVPSESENISQRADGYIAKITELETEYRTFIKSVEAPRLIFADRFPFAYLTADLNIEYCAAFSGCSTENNADLSTVTRLAEKMREWNKKYVFITESSDGRLASSVIAAAKISDGEILTLDSMQSLTRARISSGEDYLSIMRKDLEVLRKALS